MHETLLWCKLWIFLRCGGGERYKLIFMENCSKWSFQKKFWKNQVLLYLLMFAVCVCICVWTGNTTDLEHVPKEDVIHVLADYLSEMTLKEDDSFGLKLPEKIPEGYHLTHKRFSKRIVYKSKPGFSVILSRERSWRLVLTDKRSRESVLTTK